MLDFQRLREINWRRSAQWMHGNNHIWTLSDWFVALTGEVGEAANIVKKLNRHRDNLIGNKPGEKSPEELKEKLADELGDIQLYLDLTAAAAGVDLEEATRRVFNRKSAELGFEERL